MRCVQQYKDGIINNVIDELQSYRASQKYINQLVEKLAEYEELRDEETAEIRAEREELFREFAKTATA